MRIKPLGFANAVFDLYTCGIKQNQPKNDKMTMKKINVLLLLVVLGASTAFAQGTLGKGGKQFNAGVGFSNWGVPIYAGLDFGVHESITIGPRISFRTYNHSYFGNKYKNNLVVLSFNGNYHFNQLLELPSEWDLYAGLTLGYYIWNSDTDYAGSRSSGIGLDAQIGARYFFSDKFGLNLEFGGGTGTGGSFGITLKL